MQRLINSAPRYHPRLSPVTVYSEKHPRITTRSPPPISVVCTLGSLLETPDVSLMVPGASDLVAMPLGLKIAIRS